MQPEQQSHGGFFMRFGLFRSLSSSLARRNIALSDAFFLNLLAVFIGILVAIFAWGFRSLIVHGSNAVRGEYGGEQLSIFQQQPWLILLGPPLGGLLCGAIFMLWGRARNFSGVTRLLESVARGSGRLDRRRTLVESINAVICIVTGMSVGIEGPTVVAGGTIGSSVSGVAGMSPSRRRVLLASGAAAGISAVFNAPLAGFFFSMELILGDFSKRAVAAIVLASVSASVTMQALGQRTSVFSLPAYGYRPEEMLWFCLLGLVCGVVAYLFAQCLQFCEKHLPRLPLALPLRLLVAGLLVSGIALIFPEVLGVGHYAVHQLLNGELPQSTALPALLTFSSPLVYLLCLAAAKLLATSICIGAGSAGGEFAPSLFIGASVGTAFGLLLGAAGLSDPGSQGAYALVGMAAIFGSIAQAPLTIILMVFEITGNYTMILPIMATGVLSQVVFYSLRRQGVFAHKLESQGLKLGRGKDLSILEAITVREAMHKGVESLSMDLSLAEARSVFAQSEHHGFPVVDEDGRLVGMLTTSDLSRHREAADSATVASICSIGVHKLQEESNCHEAIALLEDFHIGRVPVVDASNRPIGIITRSDIVGAYKLALQLRAREIAEED